jgi:transketolase N-terminal domain/subunit
MATFTVRQGRRYRATISLGMLERLASNDMIAERLRAAGFSDVTVTGSGADRIAEAVWSNPDTSADMPKQIATVTEV